MSLTDEIIQRYNDSRTARMAQEEALNRTPLNTLADVGFQSNAASHIGMMNQGIGNLVALANIGNTRAENQRQAAVAAEALARDRELQDAELMFKSKDADIAGRNAAVNERNAAANEQQVRQQGQANALKLRALEREDAGIAEHNRLVNMADAEIAAITSAYEKVKTDNAGILSNLMKTGAVEMVQGVPTPTATMNDDEKKEYLKLLDTSAPDVSGLDAAAQRLYDAQDKRFKIQSKEELKTGLLGGVNNRITGVNTVSDAEGKLIAAEQEDYAARRQQEDRLVSAGEWARANNIGASKLGDDASRDELMAAGAAVMENTFYGRSFAQEEAESEKYKQDSTFWVGGPREGFGTKFATQNNALYAGKEDDFDEVSEYANQAAQYFKGEYERITKRKLDITNPYAMEAFSKLIHQNNLLKAPAGEKWDATVSGWRNVDSAEIVSEIDKAVRFQQKAIRNAETGRSILQHNNNIQAGHAAKHGGISGVKKYQDNIRASLK